MACGRFDNRRADGRRGDRIRAYGLCNRVDFADLFVCSGEDHNLKVGRKQHADGGNNSAGDRAHPAVWKLGDRCRTCERFTTDGACCASGCGKCIVDWREKEREEVQEKILRNGKLVQNLSTGK